MPTNGDQAADVSPENDKDFLDERQAELTERLVTLSKVGETALAELKASGADARHISNLTNALQRRMDSALETLERANGQKALEIPNVRRLWHEWAERDIRFYETILEEQSQPPERFDPLNRVCRTCGLVMPAYMKRTCRPCYDFEIDNSVLRTAPPASLP